MLEGGGGKKKRLWREGEERRGKWGRGGKLWGGAGGGLGLCFSILSLSYEAGSAKTRLLKISQVFSVVSFHTPLTPPEKEVQRALRPSALYREGSINSKALD